MNPKEKRKIREQREYDVVKANELIQNSRFHLTLQEQKIVLYLISKIKPEDNDLKDYMFNIKDFCQICGIDYKNGQNYIDIKKTIQDLRDKSFWVKVSDTKETLFSWINYATIERNDGIIEIGLSSKMKPYLLQLREKFTQYKLIYTLGMKSQYSVRIYELLKSYENMHRKLFFVDDLKSMLMCEKESYKNFNNFKVKILDTAVKEINALTDISVEFETMKEGKKITQVEFVIKSKKDLTERLKTISAIEKLLDDTPQI